MFYLRTQTGVELCQQLANSDRVQCQVVADQYLSAGTETTISNDDLTTLLLSGQWDISQMGFVKESP